MAKNKDLIAASKAKKDEFYTQLEDIELELKYYRDHFRDKIVYCNCDDPTVSNFNYFFLQNFHFLGLKQLVTTCYKSQNREMFSQHDTDTSIGLRYDGASLLPDEFALEGDGDFRSAECKELLKEADIVVTNPPFSLFREYVAQLMKYNKQFLIIGNMNATTYKEIFPLFQQNKIWYGASIKSGDREFGVPKHYPLEAATTRVDDKGNRFIRVKGVRWFTNLDYRQRHEDLILYKRYSVEEYPKYDKYDAINVDVTKEIPYDYDGAIGVPISFLDKHNPDQFEIISANDIRLHEGVPVKKHGLIKDKDGAIDGKPKYFRIVIRRKEISQS
ncbi:MAG: adenine-specific methyltransferase EcoRI family protein [Gammaproteobacteria bacterium]|nr:adenine-specific methyltransferase EcoRI family protein [Gammaproteobacteria bacterium]